MECLMTCECSKCRGIVQLVERRSPKPDVVGSSPTAPVSGPVAQLVRAPACHAGGRGFESLLGRSIFN